MITQHEPWSIYQSSVFLPRCVSAYLVTGVRTCRVIVQFSRQGVECARPNSTVTNRVIRWIFQRLAQDRISVAATAKALGLGWDLTCSLALEACRDLVYNDPDHLTGVKIIGVDEHKWSHNRRAQGGGFVTIDRGHDPPHG